MNNQIIEVDFSESLAELRQQNMVTKLLNLQLQFKVFHWQTFSLAKHLAFGKLYDELSDMIDEFVETYQGSYQRIDFNGDSIFLENLNPENFGAIISENISVLKTWDLRINNTDLLNIRDEILGVLNRTTYLLTFN